MSVSTPRCSCCPSVVDRRWRWRCYGLSGRNWELVVAVVVVVAVADDDVVVAAAVVDDPILNGLNGPCWAEQR